MAPLKENYLDILQNIKEISSKAQLIAISKTVPAALCEELLKMGHLLFGENRVQEASEKWPKLRHSYENIQLHLVGPLQSNKARHALELFDVIQTLDREKIAILLAEEQKKTQKYINYYIQVNIGEEEQKAGIAPQYVKEFGDHCRGKLGLNVIGLMCIPPAQEPSGIYFALLQKLAKDCKLNNLSMGMSQDYITALSFGATDIRVGSALFGRRASLV